MRPRTSRGCARRAPRCAASIRAIEEAPHLAELRDDPPRSLHGKADVRRGGRRRALSAVPATVRGAYRALARGERRRDRACRDHDGGLSRHPRILHEPRHPAPRAGRDPRRLSRRARSATSTTAGAFATPTRGSHIDFFIDYAFSSRVLALLMGAVFDKAVRKYTAAFEARAHALYDAPTRIATAKMD